MAQLTVVNLLQLVALFASMALARPTPDGNTEAQAEPTKNPDACREKWCIVPSSQGATEVVWVLIFLGGLFIPLVLILTIRECLKKRKKKKEEQARARNQNQGQA
jgi:hypothetical protein